MLDRENCSEEIKNAMERFDSHLNIGEHLSVIRRTNYAQRSRVMVR
ncbi:MAG: hypothetical protein ACP5UO_04800 [Thermoplasmata archaeon]